MRTILILFFFMTARSTGICQIPQQTIQDFDSLSSPTLLEIKPERTGEGLQWKFASYDVVMILPQEDDFVTFSFTRQSKRIAEFESYWGGNSIFANPDSSPARVYTFDADQNGHQDLFVVEPDWGSMGNLGSEAPKIHAFFFAKDQHINFQYLSSIGGSVDLFKDYNNDGKFEFTCIKYFGRPDSGRGLPHFGINIFGFKWGNLQNITDIIPGFPIVFTIEGWNDPIPRFHRIQDVPSWIHSWLYFNNCNAYEREF